MKKEEWVIEKYFKPEVGSFFGIPINEKRSKKFLLAIINWAGDYQQQIIKQRDKDLEFFAHIG